MLQQKEQLINNKNLYKKGTFGYDVNLLSEKENIVLLKSKDSNEQVLLCPAYQGRVMTSTSGGENGQSFGWINHELIKNGEKQEKIHVFGGEDRFWLGPEGGQFSIFFKEGSEFTFENWVTPKEIDTEKFDLISHNETTAVFQKKMSLVNYSGFKFNFHVDRVVNLLDEQKITEIIGKIPTGISKVAFETINAITNTGKTIWTEETGMLSIWILGMFKPSELNTIIIPYRNEENETDFLNDAYFGKISSERLKIGEKVIFFKADGKSRGKIGLSPKNVEPYAGSYDAKNNLLTIVEFTTHHDTTKYVNSMWEMQKNPFEGDVVNAYNDGLLDDGSQLGPFYELESSSPAANLGTDDQMVHIHRTFHFSGIEAELNKISLNVFGVSIQEIKEAFN